MPLKATHVITIQARRHPNAFEALQDMDAAGDVDHAILLGGMYLTVTQTEVDRLEAAGVGFALLSYHEPTGRIMTVPVGD